MRFITATAFLLASTSIHASGWTDLHGRNDFGESITVSEEWVPDPASPDGASKPSGINVGVNANGKGQVFKGCNFTHAVQIEDPPFLNTFSCPEKGGSPLAGATYRYKAGTGMECGAILVCVGGCGPRAPRELYQDPWECIPNTECPTRKTADHGVINGNDVILRENPHTASRILRTLSKGMNVKIVRRNTVCFAVDTMPGGWSDDNSKAGAWAQVKVLDGKAPQEGWIFDLYIDYQNQQ